MDMVCEWEGVTDTWEDSIHLLDVGAGDSGGGEQLIVELGFLLSTAGIWGA